MNGKQQGFTYIALLIGVAIIGATLAAVGEVWHTVLQGDREKELLFVGHQFQQAIDHYYASNRRYPLSLDELVLDDRTAVTKRHLRKIFVDPITGNSEWGLVKLQDGQIFGVYSLSEEKPLKRAGFQLAYVDFENKDKYSEWVFITAVRSVAYAPARPAPGQPSTTPRPVTTLFALPNHSRTFAR